MSSQAISGVGTKFQRWDGVMSLGGWEDIAEIYSINGPGLSREIIDATSLDSVGGYREFIASIRNGGTVSLSMNFTRTTYERMKDDFESRTIQLYQIVLPDPDVSILAFQGRVMEIPLNIPFDDKVSCDISIQVTQKPTLQALEFLTTEDDLLLTTEISELLTT